MQIDATQSNAIKLRVLEQFYGLEEYMDLEEPVPDMLRALDGLGSEFCFVSALSNLDLWFIRVSNVENKDTWNPFKEPLSQYAQRHDFLTAHIYPDKQWRNDEILKYVGLSETQ